MQISIQASDLAPGDIIHDDGNCWRVDTATINPRRKDAPDASDLLVDVDATGVGFVIPCKRFSSHLPTDLILVERPE